MKKLIIALGITILALVPLSFAEGLSLSVNTPNSVKIDDEFNVSIDIKVNDKNISGFECTVQYPPEKLQLVNVSENEKIKKESGRFYQLKRDNSSVFVAFVLLKNPINTDFHLMTLKMKAVKTGPVLLSIKPVASDENGKKITIKNKIINISVVGGENKSTLSNDSAKKNDDNIIAKIISLIMDLFSKVFGG